MDSCFYLGAAYRVESEFKKTAGRKRVVKAMDAMYDFLDPKGKEIKIPSPKRKVVSYSTGAKMVTVISKFKE